MLVFPEIQISGGKVVTRISPAAENIVHPITPDEAVRKFEAQGAERLHLIDVDAALGRETTNHDLIAGLIASTQIPVQIAGGMRTLHHIESWFDAGAAHVVLGTLAITNQQLLAEACARFPGAILANVATRDGYVMIDGWRTQTAFRPQDIVYDLQMSGVAGIIHFDIDRLEGDASTSLALTMEMNQDVVIPVYSSGTVHSIEDMARLRYLPNIHGVIIGEALIHERFSLQEALQVAAQRETSPQPEVETAVDVRGIQHPRKVYLASYSLSPTVRWWNQDLRQAVTDDNPYIEMVIPQEDLDIDPATLTPRALQAAYEKVVDDADAVVVVLDGIDYQAWTGFECGYARARGKYLLGIATDAPNEARTPFEAMCDDVIVIDPQEDRQIVFASIAKQMNAHLLVDRDGS
ncbi:MAG: HisA/HisF-related TIM barrel protein [Thiotrichales bacterium]|nr:HisA/HisF-related TIM barrel protein [Thiotrichales bacterium]MCY4285202.1 HisA/HisF-related TIM barrel protein [Thiotrichales bacterium]